MRGNPLIVILLLLSIFISENSKAHPGVDPILTELNDYLMAIQVLKSEDEQAREIFTKWQELRAASWKIRELTDDQDLLIGADEVMRLIGTVKSKRLQLLKACKEYFNGIIKSEPHIQIAIDGDIQINWSNPVLKVPVQKRRILPVEILNPGKESANIIMKSSLHDEILFWNKQISLDAGSQRFTFVVLAPIYQKESRNILKIIDSLGKEIEIPVRLIGLAMDENETNHQDVDFQASIKFQIRDQLTEEQLAARIEVMDSAGNSYWSPLKGPAYGVGRRTGWTTPLWDFQPGPYFYISGEAQLGIDPHQKTAMIHHGFEYLPESVEIPPDGKVDIQMKRWINMPERGWYSGHTHIHTTDAGMPVSFSQYWPIVSQGEDFHVSSILTLKGEWNTHAVYADEYPMGERKAFSTPRHLITYGEEYRNNPYGHLAFIGLDELIQPISSGALGELGGPDYPPNTYILDDALSQGASTIAAHFGNFTRGVDQIQTPWPSTGFEMPVDIALGKIHLAEIYGNGGQLEVWYDILNCGFKVPATAGPDWDIKDSPRAYVYLGSQPFTLENWTQGLQMGRSFITRGPMLFFEVNGEYPGSTIQLQSGPAPIQVTAEVLLPTEKGNLEIIFNGQVIANGIDIDTTLTIHDSGWLAARCEGAHSNPVYIQIEGRPAGEIAPARKFITVIERLEQWVKAKGLYENENQKMEVLDVLEQGRKIYEQIIGRATKLGRQ